MCRGVVVVGRSILYEHTISFWTVLELCQKYNVAYNVHSSWWSSWAQQYSLIYCRSVSCKCPEDNPERKPIDSVAGRRVALHCDLIVMVLHESELLVPLILPGYLIACTYTANYTNILLLTSHTDHADNAMVIDVNQFKCILHALSCSLHGVFMWCPGYGNSGGMVA